MLKLDHQTKKLINAGSSSGRILAIAAVASSVLTVGMNIVTSAMNLDYSKKVKQSEVKFQTFLTDSITQTKLH